MVDEVKELERKVPAGKRLVPAVKSCLLALFVFVAQLLVLFVAMGVLLSALTDEREEKLMSTIEGTGGGLVFAMLAIAFGVGRMRYRRYLQKTVATNTAPPAENSSQVPMESLPGDGGDSGADNTPQGSGAREDA